MPDEKTESERRLSGKLLDANGQQGTIDVELAGERRERSSWTVQLAQRDGEPMLLRGESAVEYDGEQVRLKPLHQDPRNIGWEASLTRDGAGRYAESALVGQYLVRGATDGFPLTRGVMILWQFR